MINFILFGSFFILLLLNVPIACSLGLSSIFAMMYAGDKFTIIPTNLYNGMAKFLLLAIPFFVISGNVMAEAGISKRLVAFIDDCVGHVKGGIAIVCVIVAMFFGAISGSGPATVAAVGCMVVPAMLEKGYSKSFTLACIACSGCIGVIIPPSIPMVIYGTSTGTSVSTMFMAGFFPGILIGLVLCLVCYVYCKKKGWKGDEKRYSWKERGKIIWEAKWALIDPIIVLGGIYGGIFTPTEAAGVAAVYAFVCGMFIYRELNFKNLFSTIAAACSTNGTTMAIIGCATAFCRVLTIQQIPALVTNAILSVSSNPIIVLTLINVLLLIVGCFMDTTPAMMVLSPILLPVALELGLSPIHFGIIMVVNLAIGFITPPLGINLFVAARIGDTKLETVCRGIVLFIAAMLFCLILITFIPALSETLPRALGMLK